MKTDPAAGPASQTLFSLEVLNAIYEVDLPGFSYGFRPGRSSHEALDALAFGNWKKWVNWILDSDLQAAVSTEH